MGDIRKGILKVEQFFQNLMRWVLFLIIGAMTLAVLSGVFFRYILRAPLPWSEELARYLMIWGVCCGVPIAFRQGSHIAVTILVDKLHGLSGRIILKISEIIDGIKHPKDINPHLGGFVHKQSRHIIRIVTISHQVLPSQQHGERGLFKIFFKDPNALKGIFTKKSVHGIEGGASPDLHSPESHAVHLFGYGDHILCPHPCCQQRLMPVPKCIILNF